MEQINDLSLLSKSEASKLLGISTNNLNKFIETGKIRFLYFKNRVRIPYYELKNFIETNLISNNEIKELVEFKGMGNEKNKDKLKNDFDSYEFFEQIKQGVN